MEKVKVRGLSAVGIIYLASDPSRVLVNMNPGSTTPRAFQWTLNLLGGGWSGRLAQADANPLSTFRRSVEADLSVTYKSAEVSVLGKDDGGFTREQSSAFLNLRKAVVAKAVPWRDYLVSIDEAVLGTVPGGHEMPYDTIVSYHLVGVDESEWCYLKETLDRFGNVSRSGLAHTATCRDIIARGQVFGFGHETAMMDFWAEHGHGDAKQLKCVLPKAAQQLGKSLSTYKEYVSTYDFAVRP